jgi:putative nucleotidyltransferase with HDIG domain
LLLSFCELLPTEVRRYGVKTGELTPQGLVDNIEDLVTLPEVALRIARMVNDPTSSATDIGREISHDAALAAKLLRIANSPLFGHQGKIATISRAITVLGVRQVRDLTVGITAVRTFEGVGNELVTMASFWRHSVLCAVAADQVAAHRGGRRGDTPFVAGLLHDIGQLVIFNRIPDLARQALLTSVDSVHDLGLYLCERNVMGFDHGAVGVALARSWGMPSSLQECIEFHHQPEQAREYPTEVATIHIANSIAVLAEIGSSDVSDAPPISPAALKAAKLAPAAIADIVAQTQQSAAEVLPLMIAA